MGTFVFIHGAWHGAWCWQSTIAALEELGHRAVAIDLPGHGNDPTPPETVVLEDYVRSVIGTIQSLYVTPVVAGHSMGGVIGALVAEQIPDAIRALVGIASPPVLDGVSMMYSVAASDPEYLGHLLWSSDRRSARIDRQGVIHFLYQRCPPDVIDLVTDRLCPEPAAPFEAPIRITQSRYGRVPRFYIGCHHDRVVTMPVQKQACESILPANVYHLDADHSPFYSATESLANCLHLISKSL